MKTQVFAYNRRIIVAFLVVVATLLLGISWLPLTASARPDLSPATPSDIGLAYVSLPDYGRVALLNTETHTYVGSVDVGAAGCDYPYQVVISPNEAYVYVACSSSVGVIATATNTVIHNINLPGVAYDIAFVQGGAYALVTLYDYNTVVVIDTATFAIVNSITAPNSPNRLAAHPYLDRVYVTMGSGGLLVVDATTFSVIGTIYLTGNPYDVIVSPDGQLIFVSSSYYQGAVIVIDANTNNVITEISASASVYHLAITPDGETLFGAGGYNGIFVFDVPTLSYTTTIYGVDEAYYPMVNCDGDELYVGGGYNNYVPVLDIPDYTVTYYVALDGYYGPRGIAICPDFAISGVALLPPVQSNDAALGDTAVHELTLVNSTDMADSYDLTLGTFNWDSALSTQQVGPLQPGEYVTFTISVTVPVSADWYDEDSVAIYATSVTSPSVYSDTAVAITQAYAPPQISASPTEFSSTQLVGEIVTDTLNLSNANGVTLTFEIRERETTPNQAHSVPESQFFAEPQPWGNNFTEERNVLTTLRNSGGSLPAILTDPLGDAVYIDVVEVAAASAGAEMTMRLTFAPGAGPNGAAGYIFLDTDQDDSTGVSPTVYAGNSQQDIGLEYYLFLFNLPYTVDIYNVDTGYIASVTPSYTSDSFEFTLPLSALGNDDGNIDVAMVVGNDVLPTDWVPDVGHGTIGAGGDALWLSTAPVSGTVATNSTLPVQVVRNATNLQPGLYTADLLVNNDDPENQVVIVPVTMTVQPTANMGWVEGTITDAGTGLPLQATIIAQGQPYTVTSNPATGYYILWLDAGTYTLQVSATGYVTETQSVNIVAQQGTTQDFDLVLNVPVIEVTHEDMAVALDVGMATSRAFTITNDGPALLAFDILKVATGYTPLVYVRDRLNLALPETAVTTSLAPGPLANMPSAVHLGGNPVLIIQDSYPWGYDSIQQILNNNGIAYDQVDSSYMATIDLSVYELVIIPSEQSWDFYNAWDANIGRFETYVEAGGALWLSGTTQGRMPLMPGGVINQYGPDSYNDVLLPDHPWVAGVSGQIFGSSASHNYFTNLSPGSQVVAQSMGYGQATLVDYGMGAGRIMLTGQTLEIAWWSNWDAAPILENSLLDMYVWEPGDVSWLVVVPISGTVAGYSAEVGEVIFDAAGLQPGAYTANVIINSNDPVNGRVTIPVTMTVSPAPGMGRVMGTVTDLWTGDPLMAQVQLVGVYTDTADPDYSIWADAGSYTLVVSASGYMTGTYNVVIPANGVVVQDIALEPAQPRLEDMPADLVITAVPGHLIPHTFTLANTGPLPLDYTWHEIAPNLHTPNAPVDLSGKVIMYDLAHGQNSQSNYSTLVTAINNAGGLLTVNYAFPITADTLNNVDVLWVDCCGYTNWTFAELQVVNAWMEAGGAVLVHSEDYPAAADVAGIYNITYECCQYSYGTTTDILPHSTTVGVSAIYLDYSYYALNYTPAANAVVRDTNGYAQAVAQEQNGGKMVVIDSSLFDNYRINFADNMLFAMNVMNWLAAPAYGDVPWLSVSPLSGAIAGHGAQEMTVMVDTTGLAIGIHEAVLAMEHNDPAYASPILLPVTVQVVQQTAAVTLTPLTTNGSGLPGAPVTYTLTVQNTGNGPDTFAISVNGDWTATPSIVTTNELMPGQSQQFTVVVQVPASAAVGSMEDTAVTATSQFNNTISQTVTLTTTAISSTVHIYLPVILKP